MDEPSQSFFGRSRREAVALRGADVNRIGSEVMERKSAGWC